MQYNADGAAHAKLYLDWIEVLATMTVASGLVPLERFALKAMLPGAPGRDLNKFRMSAFLIFFVWIGSFQDMIIGTATMASGFWRHHKPVVLAFEMLLVQLMVHKAFVGESVAMQTLCRISVPLSRAFSALTVSPRPSGVLVFLSSFFSSFFFPPSSFALPRDHAGR